MGAHGHFALCMKKHGRQTVIVFNNIPIVKVAGQDTLWRISFDLPATVISIHLLPSILPISSLILSIHICPAFSTGRKILLIGILYGIRIC